MTTRGAFHRQGLFVGSGGLYDPGPATTTLDRLSAKGGNRWTTLSRHPESWPVLHRSHQGIDEGRHTSGRFIEKAADAFAPESFPTRLPFTRIATLFGALHASLFGVWTLPADFCNCHDVRTPTGALVSSQGRRP